MVTPLSIESGSAPVILGYVEAEPSGAASRANDQAQSDRVGSSAKRHLYNLHRPHIGHRRPLALDLQRSSLLGLIDLSFDALRT